MHPVQIIQALFSLLKNSALILIYLFIVQMNETSLFLTSGRIIFLAFLGFQVLAIVVKWLNTTYEIKEQQIHFYRGIFKKRHNRVALANVQNIQRSTPFYFKLFKVTSLHLETSATDERASVTFDAITLEEAERVEQVLEEMKSQQASSEDSLDETVGEQSYITKELTDGIGDGTEEIATERTVIFQPSRQELFRASFLSLSFLVVIPIIITFFENMKDVITFEDQLSKIFQQVVDSWILIGVALFVIAVILFGLGVGWTFLNYGKYKISADHNHIYIRMGVLSERSLSIHKTNVQALQISQTPIKKWLRLCEIKLISAESHEDEPVEINSLFPYMQKERAFTIAHQLLPAFPLQEQMHRLPKKSLWIRMIRIPWLVLVAFIYFILFQQDFWFVPLILLVIVYVLRFFDYRNTRYTLKNDNIQLQQGGLWLNGYVTHRKKVIEVEVKRSFLQQKFGLATITIINQTKPVHHESLQDVPVAFADQLIDWYGKRNDPVFQEKH